MKERVYVLCYDVDYQPGFIESVHRTKEGAKKALCAAVKREQRSSISRQNFTICPSGLQARCEDARIGFSVRSFILKS